MDAREFDQMASAALVKLEAAFEKSDADLDFELAPGGILEIEFADGSKMIINRHAAAQEIWVAARAGGFHFRHDGANWVDTRDGVELFERVATLATQQAGEPVRLT